MLEPVLSTHASRVIAEVRWRDVASGTVTTEFPPLKLRALPNLPRTHAVLASVPVFPFPDESVAVVPEPALKEKATTGDGPVAWGVVALAVGL